MTLPSMLTRAALADLINVADINFALKFNQERSLTGGGDTLYADRAPAMWAADITSAPMTHADAEARMALINSRGGALKTLLLYNYKLQYPSTDPTGIIFGANTPVVGTIADRLHVAFTAFPANYTIPVGTFFQIIFDTSRYYLGQFCETKTSSGAGAVTSTEVFPPLPDSVDPGDAVTVLQPAMKARIVPGSAFPSLVGMKHSTITLKAEQTYSA